MPHTSTRTSGRTLIPDAVFDRLTRRLTTDHGLDDAYAARIVDQTGAFLKACADNPNLALAPSMAVDLGWHAFVLHTAAYAAFCQRIAGRFIHHEPTDDAGDGSDQARQVLKVTVDPELWAAAADCSQCHAGCTDSPSH